MIRRAVGLALIAMVAVGLTACGSDSGGTTKSATAVNDGADVVVQTFRFRPTVLKVNAGTTVTWTNRDDILHTVTSDNDAFDAPLDGPKSTFSRRFAKPGTYSYHCSRHAGMNARVVVSK